jgi:hypothetical protein
MRQLRNRLAIFLAVAATLLTWCSGAQAQSGGTTAITPPATTAEKPADMVWIPAIGVEAIPAVAFGPAEAEPAPAEEFPEPAFGGSVAISLGHTDVGNGFRYTAEPQKPMLVADVTAKLGRKCTFGVYAVHAIRHDTAAGDVREVDPRVSCDFFLSESSTLTIGVEEWFTTGPNVTLPSVSIAHGQFDLTAKYLAVDGGPDGQRAELGFTPELKGFDLRLAGGIERGLGAKPAAVVYATAEQKLGTDSRWSVFGEAVYGFAEQGDPRRGGKVHVGVRFSF